MPTHLQLDKPFLAHKNTNVSKPKGTNTSTLGLNNIANYLDYFPNTYRSLILVATWQSQIDG